MILHLTRGNSSMRVPLPLPATLGEIGGVYAALDEISTEAPTVIDSVDCTKVPNIHRYLRSANLDDLNKLNQLAERINGMTNQERWKFSGALDANSINGLDDVLSLMDHLDEYILIPNVNTDTELGRYIAAENAILTAPLFLERICDYLDFRKIGAEYYADHGGAYTYGGYVLRRDSAPTMDQQSNIDVVQKTMEVRVSVENADMTLYDFISNVSDMVNSEDKTAALNWVSFASFLHDADYDNTTLEKELREVYLPLRFVQNNFSNDVLQQSLDMELLGNEVIFGAILFAAGYSEDEVRELGNRGVLMDGYSPLSEDETGSLSVVSISDSEEILFIVQNEDADRILQCVQRAAEVTASEGSNIQILLSDPAMVGLRIRPVTDLKFVDAIKKSCTESTAFSNITVYEQAAGTVTQYSTMGLTTAQRDDIFRGDESPTLTLKM